MPKLITYPHGLGDCLMLTPLLREYYKQKGEKLSVAILKRFENTKVFDNNPYIDRIFYIKDPWNDFENPTIGFQKIVEIGKKLASDNGLGHVFINHTKGGHKILENAEHLNIQLDDKSIDVFINDEEKKIADNFIKSKVGDSEYGFIQTYTGIKGKTNVGHIKDLPDGYGEKWLRRNTNLEKFIEVQKDFQYDEFNINVQFEILRRASAVCIPDSIFYHACSGLDKNIDYVFFGRGKQVYDRVHKINDNMTENYTYELEEL